MKNSNNLEKLRKEKKLTQKSLAEILDIDQSIISRIENGQDNLQFETAKKLASALGVTVVEIFPDLAVPVEAA